MKSNRKRVPSCNTSGPSEYTIHLGVVTNPKNTPNRVKVTFLKSDQKPPVKSKQSIKQPTVYAPKKRLQYYGNMSQFDGDMSSPDYGDADSPGQYMTSGCKRGRTSIPTSVQRWMSNPTQEKSRWVSRLAKLGITDGEEILVYVLRKQGESWSSITNQLEKLNHSYAQRIFDRVDEKVREKINTMSNISIINFDLIKGKGRA